MSISPMVLQWLSLNFPSHDGVILSLRRIWRAADMHFAAVGELHARSFRTKVPQDDAGALYSHELSY
jgi:hypothetical protein